MVTGIIRRLSHLFIAVGMMLLVGCASSPKPVVLEGYIRDTYTNAPIKDAHLLFGSQAPVVTADNGHFTTSTWSPKDTLKISAPGYEPAALNLSEHAELVKPQALTVTLDTLLRPDTLRGIVRDTFTGHPVVGAVVKTSTAISATTDAQGLYLLKQVPEAFRIDISARDYAPTHQDIHRQIAQDVAIRPSVVRGTVKDAYSGKGIAGIAVKAGAATAATGADGTYMLHDVPETGEMTFAGSGYDAGSQSLPRATNADMALRPNVVHGTVKDTETGHGIAGVVVSTGSITATSGADGTYELTNVPQAAAISFAHDGYDAITNTLAAQTSTLDATLRSNVVSGAVVDAQDGKPLAEATVIATTTVSGTAIAFTRTDANGHYQLQNVPDNAYVKALMPGYLRGETQLTPGGRNAELQLTPFTARALYIKAPVASSGMKTVDQYFDVVDKTELNSVVLDLKSDNLADVGFIYYQSQVPEIVEAGTSADYMPIHTILAEAKKRHIYMIARIHIFAHDNALLKVHPDWYVQKDGKPWFADFGIAWLDTYDEHVWDYNIKLAVEAAQMGFDEVQFDYIRFPSDGSLKGAIFKGPRDSHNHPEEMFNTIGRFMERAQRAINGAGAYFAVDVFGYVTWEPQAAIGQNLQVMGQYADYVYPMVYPSAFIFGELGYKNPAAHPFEFVDFSMKKIKDQLIGPASRAKVRPWLQDFTLIWVPEQYIVHYGTAEVRAQIDAAEQNRANGVDGWALWDSDNQYTVSALKAEH